MTKELSDLLKDIDTSPLAAKMSNMFGFPVKEVELSPITNSNLGSERPGIIPIDVPKEHFGAFRGIIKSAQIDVFSSSFREEMNCVWLDINLRYEHPNGGRNGCSSFSALYVVDKGVWKFRDEASDEEEIVEVGHGNV